MKMLRTTIFVVFASIQIAITFAETTPDPNCGITKGCYPDPCPAGGCTDFHLSWEDAGEFMRFKMVTPVPVDALVWTAIGFSLDNKMKNSSVVMCRQDTMSAEIGHTDPTYYAYAPLKTVSSLTNINVSFSGSYMTCVFSRIKIAKEFTNQIFSLNLNLYLLNAHGIIAVKGAAPTKHIKRSASASPMSFVHIGPTPTPTVGPSTPEPSSTSANAPTSSPMVTSTNTPTPRPINSAMPIMNTVSSMFLTCLLMAVNLMLME